MSGIPNSFDAQIWTALLQQAPRGYRVVAKESSWLRWLAPTFATTIGRTTYMPRSAIEGRHWWLLRHEILHAEDYAKQPVWFVASYAFPQGLAAFALLALLAIGGNLWWLASLANLVALVLPSPGRTHWERRGYLMTTVCCALKYGDEFVTSTSFVQQVVGEFTGGSYLWMDPLRSNVETWVLNDVRRALAIVRDQYEDPDYSPAVRTIRAAMRGAA